MIRKNKKIFKNSLKPFLFFSTMAIGFSASIVLPLVINVKNDFEKNRILLNNNFENDLINNFPAAQNPLTDVGIIQRAPEVSPKFIYHLSHLNSDQFPGFGPNVEFNNLDSFLTKYMRSMNAYHLFTSEEIQTLYLNALKDLKAGYDVFANENIILTGAIKAKQIFSDPSILFENYNKINNFGTPIDVGKKLTIFKPQEVRDIFTATISSSDEVLSQSLLNTDNFAYKVAEINLDKFKDQKSLVFSIKDNSQQDNADHDYKLIISNQNHEILDFLTKYNSDLSKADINTLLKNQTFFIRDIGSKGTLNVSLNGSNSAPIKSLSKFKFVYNYNTSTHAKTISLLVTPSNDNSESKPLEIEVDKVLSDPEAVKNTTLKYGFLDNSLSPIHTNSIKDISHISSNILWDVNNPIDPSNSLIPSDSQKFVEDFNIFSISSLWRNNVVDDEIFKNGVKANLLRMFLMQENRIVQHLQFAGQTGTDAFNNGENSLQIVYEQKVLTITPNSFFITSNAINQHPNVSLDQPFAIFSKAIDNPNSEVDQYLQLDIALTKGVIGFDVDGDDNENKYTIPNATSKIFFEDPFSHGVTNIVQNDRKDFRTEGITETTSKSMELIADVLRNWSGFETSATPQTFISPNSKIFSSLDKSKWTGTDQGISTYGPDLFARFAEKYRSFMYSYLHFFVDATGKIRREDETQVGIYKYDASTFMFDTDSSGNKIPLDTTGQALYRHFIQYTNALTRWSTEKLGLDESFGINKVGEYELLKPSSSIGFAESVLINRSGVEGQDLKNISNLLTRIWVGDALTVQETNKFEELKKLFDDVFFEKIPVYKMDSNGNLILVNGSPVQETNSDGSLKFITKRWWEFISGKGKKSDNGILDINSPEFLKSKQYMYYILQPYFAKMINKLLEVETIKFDQNLKLSLKTYFGHYLNDKLSKVALSDSLIKNIQTDNPNLKGMMLVSVGQYGVVRVDNGKESLKSLLQFIYGAGLQNRFLKEQSDIDIINNFVSENKLDSPDLLDQKNQTDFVKFINAISQIIDKTLYKNNNYISLTKIVDKIISGAYDTSKGNSAIDDLNNLFRQVVLTISENHSFDKLNFLGINSNLTYIQSLVMGKNIGEIFKQYLKRTDIPTETRNFIQKFLDEQKQYDINSLTNLAISLKFYNLDYFVEALTEESKVVETAQNFLNQSNLEDVSIEIDSKNDFISFLSNPNNITKYAFIGISFTSSFVGLSAFGLTFRRSIRASSKKNIIFERLLFMSITFIGIALAIFGILPGLL